MLYLLSLYFGFWVNKILYFFFIIIIFFIFIHFLIIEFKNYIKGGGYFLIYLGLFVFFILFIGFNNIFLIISVLMYHVGLFFLSYLVNHELVNRKVISIWSVVYNGTYIFSVFITLTFASLFLAMFHDFPLNCNTIYSYSDKVIDNVKNIFNLKGEETLNIKQKIDKTSNITISDFLGLNYFIEKIQKKDFFVKNKLDSTINDNLLLDKKNTGILGYLENLKIKLIDNVVSDNKLVNKGICNFLVEEIVKRFSNPAFKFSALFLMFVLLSPFLRIIFYLVAIINYFLLNLFFLFKIYKFKIVLGEVEDIV